MSPYNNKQTRENEMFFLTIKCNHPGNWFRLESSMDVKAIRQNFEEKQYIYRVSKYLPTNYLLITKGKMITFQLRNSADIILTKRSN